MRILFFAGLLILTSQIVGFGQQRYAHVNLGNLIAAMSETEKANESLKSFQEGLIAERDRLAEELQVRYSKYMEDKEQGRLAPKSEVVIQEEIERDRNELYQLEQSLSGQIAAKREELLKPIFEKAQEAIRRVAEEQGYLMVFDTSAVLNGILFTQDSDDILSLVKSKLGI